VPRTKQQTDPEPTFLGVWCRGPNPEHAAKLREEAKARELLAKFYELKREDQLIMAAIATEMTKDRGG